MVLRQFCQIVCTYLNFATMSASFGSLITDHRDDTALVHLAGLDYRPARWHPERWGHQLDFGLVGSPLGCSSCNLLPFYRWLLSFILLSTSGRPLAYRNAAALFRSDVCLNKLGLVS